MSIDELHIDVLSIIFSYCSTENIYQFRFVSKHYKNIICHHILHENGKLHIMSIKHNDLEILSTVIQNDNFDEPMYLFKHAIKSGHIKMVSYLYNLNYHNKDIDKTYFIYDAIKSGHLHIAIWLLSKNFKLSYLTNTFDELSDDLNARLQVINLVKTNNLPMLKWLGNNNWKFSGMLYCKIAIVHNKIDLLHFFCNMGCTLEDDDISKLLLLKNMDMIQLIHDSHNGHNFFEFEENLNYYINQAIKYDYFKFIYWLHSNKYLCIEKSDFYIHIAIESNKLKMLYFLLHLGYNFSINSLRFTTKFNPHIIKLIDKHLLHIYIKEAIFHEDFLIIKWLYCHNFLNIRKTIEIMIIYDKLYMLSGILDIGCVPSIDNLITALIYNKLLFVQLINLHKPIFLKNQIFFHKCIESMIRLGNINILIWLFNEFKISNDSNDIIFYYIEISRKYDQKEICHWLFDYYHANLKRNHSIEKKFSPKIKY